MADQMRKDRMSLADLVALYGENKKGSSDETARRCAEMLRREPPEDINKIQKTWYTLVKQDSAKDKDVYANVKVLFLKLRNNNNKLKKLQRAGEQQRDEGSRSCGSTEADEATGSRKETRLRHNREPRRGDRELDRDIEQERDRDSDENEGDHVDADKTCGFERGRHYLPPTGSRACPLCCDPWLNGAEERREAVCALLRLDETPLNKGHSDILGESEQPQHSEHTEGPGPERSTHLIDRLNSLSTERWVEKALAAFPKEKPKQSHLPRKASRSKRVPVRDGAASSSLLLHKTLRKARPEAEHSKPRYRGAKRCPQTQRFDPRGKSAVKRHTHRQWSGPVVRRPANPKDSGFAPKRPRTRRVQSDSLCLSEAEEAEAESCTEREDYESNMELEVLGDDLAATAKKDDDRSSPDDYDYSDEFIDDSPLETDLSSSSDDDGGDDDDDDGDGNDDDDDDGDGDGDVRGQAKRKLPKERKGTMGDAASLRSRQSGRGFYSDSGEEDYARSADRNSADVDLRYKRADRQGRISRPSKRIKKQESLSVALRDANEQQGHRLFPGGKGTKVKSKVVQLKPPGHSNLIRSKRYGEGFSPERPRPSSPQASNVTRSIKSSPFKKPKGMRVEEKEKQRRRASPGAGKTRITTHRETRLGASTKSGSDSESQEDQEPPSRKLRNTTSGDTETAPSGTGKSNRRHAWIESESEVGSDNGEGYAKSDEGPIREDVERMSGESSLSDSSAESEEYKDRRGSRQAKRKRPDPPRETTALPGCPRRSCPSVHPWRFVSSLTREHGGPASSPASERLRVFLVHFITKNPGVSSAAFHSTG
ncbi:Hypothetical protein SMAX5B_007689 [Scophthalmus maximus]|uniref:Uncharacterized protein n=1 Tax=Scophthalmus maximus TaxID=52904 RepID=A0A2U9B1N1_SCOMX|nr:Hypothetical protein SMAX5B_007689 [Scophthalmus maximus]